MHNTPSEEGQALACRREAGFALPTAMFFILGMLAILSIGAVAAVNTQRGTVRDANSKSALAVAESGVETALLRLNEYQTELDDYTPCLAADFTAQPRAVALAYLEGNKPAGGWCASVPSTDTGQPFTYWVRPYKLGTEQMADIVSQATIDDVTRKVVQTVAISSGSPGGYKTLGAANVVGIDYVEMWGDAQVRGGVGSNGTVHLEGSANVCGAIRTGTVPFTTDNSSSRNPPRNCQQGRTSVQGIEEYPPAMLPEGLTPETSATNRFFSVDGSDLPAWYIGTPQLRKQHWNPDTRTLTIDGGQTLRMSADTPYLICRLVLNGGGKLSMENPDGPVTIFIDAPENCPGQPSVPFTFQGGTEIRNNGFIPGIFVLGSDSIATTANPTGGALTEGAVIYAPRTKFVVNGDFFTEGALIAKSIDMSGGAEIFAFDGMESYELPVSGESGPGEIVKERFSECTATPVVDPTIPDQGC